MQKHFKYGFDLTKHLFIIGLDNQAVNLIFQNGDQRSSQYKRPLRLLAFKPFFLVHLFFHYQMEMNTWTAA